MAYSIASGLAKKASSSASSNSDGSDASSQDIIDAVHARDHKALKQALQNFKATDVSDDDITVSAPEPIG